MKPPFIRIAVLLGILTSTASAADETAGKTVTLGDPTAAPLLPTALQEAYTSGARDITIAPGNYILPATGRSAISLVEWKNVLVHARGVTLIFEELAHRPFSLQRCEGVTLDGASLQFATPAFTQGRILAIGRDDKGDYFDWQIDDGYSATLDVAKSTFDVADQHTRRLKFGTGDIGFATSEPLADHRLRLRNSNGLPGTAVVGDWLFTRIKPCEPIVHLDGCTRCTLRAVTLRNAGFAAFFETGGEGGHTYVECKVAPGPRPTGATEDQLVGCGADGFHSSGVRLGPTIERCVWEGLLHDDCIAIHGALQNVEHVEADLLILEKGNRGGFVLGEPVRMSNTAGFFNEFTCKALRILADERLELTLDRPSGASVNSKASNPRHNGAGFKILNCTLGNTRSRGILIKADHGLIEGNTISGCGMSAISLGPEFYWNEADYAQHVIVRGNTFTENVLNGSTAGTLYLHGDGAIGNADITITDNLFDKNYGQTALHIAYTDGVLATKNRFIASPWPLLGKARTLLHLENSRNIALVANTVENPAAEDKLITLGKNVENLTGYNPEGILAVSAK